MLMSKPTVTNMYVYPRELTRRGGMALPRATMAT